MSETDTIIALATPAGTSALGLIRISGPSSAHWAAELTDSPIQAGKSNYRFLKFNGEILDDVIIHLWNKPHSYTGEETIEISCHGNPLLIDQIINAFIQMGARHARPGEFTERAYLNGKIDLTQAESVMDIISARSERALRSARKIQAGGLTEKLTQWRDELLDILAQLEAYIDFPDEDISPQTNQEILSRLRSCQDQLDRLLQTAREGRLLREGVSVAIVGAPNVGKSSLLNALTGENRAIVSSRAGTTRDTIDATLLLEGILTRFIDTAGLHGSEDEIEKLGMERTHETIQTSDLVLLLMDGTDPHPILIQIPKETPSLLCYTKSDLKEPPASQLGCNVIEIDGLDRLKSALIDALKLKLPFGNQELVAINDRHARHLQAAESLLLQILNQWSSENPPELISSDLRHALHQLDEILGQTDNEEVLDKLFAQFCIGK
ncbi:MAG: tRNA uridine-5-carboxymethylaminomethyl(34) synthesis GTPase MnmE [Verrucomicrobiota bacterium]